MRFTHLFVCVFLTTTTLFGQSNAIWTLAAESELEIVEQAERNIEAHHYQLARLDLPELQSVLATAAPEFSDGIPAYLLLPLPDGSLHRFQVYDSPVMRPRLQAKYPKIRSFAAQSVSDARLKARIGYGYKGFHAAIRSPKGMIFIDPYLKDQQIYYASYYLKDIVTDQMEAFTCGVDGAAITENPLEGIDFDEEVKAHREAAFRGSRGQPAVLRVYDFGLSCTGEFGAMHGGVVEDVASVLETATNRLNLIFENELAVRLMLIDNNDVLISVDGAADFFNNPLNGGGLLGQNQTFLDGLIRPQNYDIGHIFTVRCTDVGGIASLGGVCGQNKAQGVTCHSSTNVSFITAVIAAHEIGHQFNANHTWSNCGGPGVGQTAMEPGSGSTIMSYAGLCGQTNNVTNSSDDYYHAVSLDEMYRFTRISNGSTCPEIVEINNHYPELDWPYQDGFHIPIGTPFELNVVATDEDGDELTYCWEQFNTGPLSTYGSPLGNAPSFRSFPPNANSNRVFPKLSRIIANSTFQLIDEVLPDTPRMLNFRCTVRDNNPEGGVAAWEDVAFFATSLAGPFEVLNPNTSIEWIGGSYTEVQWDVSNTDLAPVNCQKVNIRLSIDGGNTYPITLATDAPNDGSHFVTVPDIQSGSARIRIDAVDNVFFDISNQNFNIVPASVPGYTLELTPFSQQVCLPSEAILEINTASLLGYNEPLQFIVNGLPPGAVAEFSNSSLKPSENGSLSINMTGVTVEGDFELELISIAPGLDTAFRYTTLSLVSNDFSSLLLAEPANGSTGVVELPDFSWSGAADANSYWFELATSPAFGNSIIISGENLDTTYFALSDLLEKNTPYFWRVRPLNECGYGSWTNTFAFHTVASSCAKFESNNVPVFISNLGTPVVESTLTVSQDAIISDLNIPLINGEHNLIKHLDVSLVSPLGTEVLLFSDICGNTSLLRVGLDDNAFSDLPCPPIGNGVHRPQNPLSAFNGESTQGTWILRMAVNDGDGEGGGLSSWNLQFCSSVSLSSPYLVNNEQLVVPVGEERSVRSELLLSQDDDNGPEDLIYTIINYTQNGVLTLRGNILQVGDQFSQTDINNWEVKYLHNGNDATSDGFTFSVSDGEGGWFGTPRFDILIDTKTSTAELEEAFAFKLFPVPAQHQLHIAFDRAPLQNLTFSVYNIQGQLLGSKVLVSGLRSSIDISQLASGLYFLHVESPEFHSTRKFSIQK